MRMARWPAREAGPPRDLHVHEPGCPAEGVILTLGRMAHPCATASRRAP